MRTAIFPGSFDPFTLGHLDVLNSALQLFDKVIVAVGYNSAKNGGFFTPEARVKIIEKVTKDMPNVTVDKCEGLLADFVLRNGFDVVVRGLRNTADFDDEYSMDQLHKHLYEGKAETVYIIADAKYSFISTSIY